jgi:nucleoid-associated protein YgaU
MAGGAVSVTTLTKSFYQLVKMQPKTHAPPRIRFSWGHDLNFVAIVESVQEKFTLFSQDGTPLRATLSVVLREYKTLEEQLTDLKLESPDHTKRRVIQRGDTLARIAAEEYGDPTEWRLIADANSAELDDPLRIPPGTVLRIPPIAVISSGTGSVVAP